MSTQVAGVLRDPFERPLANTDIDIRAITNTFAVLPGATVKVTTNSLGEYNFILEPANYAVSVILDGRAVYQGTMSITSTTAPGTLPELLKQAEMEAELPLNYAEYFRQVQETVKDDADRAQAAANGIEEQVDEARAYAQQSAASAASSEQSSQDAQQALADTQVIANKFQNLDDAVTETQQNAAQTSQDAAQTAADRAAADAAAQRAEDAADSAETVNERNIRVPMNETINALPAASSRQNSFVSFDQSGQAQVTPFSSVAILDSNSKVPLNNLPATVINETFAVASQAEMLALTAQQGDVAARTDINRSFILKSAPASTLANWIPLLQSPVVTVNGKSGDVVLSGDDIALAKKYASWRTRTASQKLSEIVHITDWAGVDPTGATDSSAAIQQAVNEVASGTTIVFPGAGSIYKFNNIDLSAKQINIQGHGFKQGATRFDAGHATNPLFKATGALNLSFSNFYATSSVARTGGKYFDFINCGRVYCFGFFSDNHYICLGFNGGTELTVDEYSVFTDVNLDGGGDFMIGEDYYTGSVNFLNGFHKIYNNSLTKFPSFGVKFKYIDTANISASCMIIQRRVALLIAPSSGHLTSIIRMNGGFDTSEYGVLIQPTGTGRVQDAIFSSAYAGACSVAAFAVDTSNSVSSGGVDGLARVRINGGSLINSAIGLEMSGSRTTVRAADLTISNNVLGVHATNGAKFTLSESDIGKEEFAANTTDIAIDTTVSGEIFNNRFRTAGAAFTSPTPNVRVFNNIGIENWTAYTPAVTARTGAITSATASARYRREFNTVFLQATVVLSNIGNATDGAIISLPVPCRVQTAGCGAERQTSGWALQTFIENGASTMEIRKYDNSFPGVNGSVLRVFATYEVQAQ